MHFDLKISLNFFPPLSCYKSYMERKTSKNIFLSLFSKTNTKQKMIYKKQSC